MVDIVTEIIRASLLGAILGYLFWIGKKEKLHQQRGWSLVLIGSALIFFGNVIDITDNFPALNPWVVVGDTDAQAFLEKIVGSLLGYSLLLLGFWYWIPRIAASRRSEAELMDEINLVDEVGETITNTLDIEKVYPEFAARMERLLPFDRLNINLLVEGTDQFKYAYLCGANPSNLTAGELYSRRNTFTGIVAETGQVHIEEDMSNMKTNPRLTQNLAFGLRSAISAPLIADGRVIGAINLRSKDVAAYGERDARILGRLSRQIAPAIVNGQVYQNLQEEAALLSDTKAELESVIESAADAIVIVDEDQVVSVFNACAEDMFGYRKEEVIGGSLDDLIPESFRGAHREHMRDFASGEEQRRRMAEGRTIFGRRKNGEEFPVEASIQKLSLQSENKFIAVLRDISEREARDVMRIGEAVHQARQQELKESRRRVLTASESLRRNIAQQLHGTVQNKLIVLQQMVAQLENKAEESSLSSEVAKLDEIFTDVIQNDVRGISHLLYPAVLRRGLLPALLSLADRMGPNLDIEKQFTEEFRLRESKDRNFIPLTTRLAAYRIAEDALTNVVKHSQSKSASLEVELDEENQLKLVVRDSGQGFEAEKITTSVGLSVMQDYAEVAGGECRITSSPNKGTEVTALLPLIAEPSEEMDSLPLSEYGR